MAARILLVDDDTDDRDIFCEALNDVAPAITCDYALNGKEALLYLAQLLGNHESLPETFFLDINLPVINGWQCLTVLKQTEALRQIPVIMYSTSSYDRDRQMAKELGALAFLSKPSDFEELKCILTNIVSHLQDGTITQLHL